MAVIAVAVSTACSFRADETKRFEEGGLSFGVPAGWRVTGFSTTVTPQRLVAASYSVSPADVEGDCGGLAAVVRLPDGGAYVVLIDYGARSGALAEFTDRLPVTALEDGQLADFECFGRSFAFRVVLHDRALQAHVGLGLGARGNGSPRRWRF